MTHDGGHLPFEGQINSALNFNGVNRVTVAVNNTLLPTTLPPGSLQFQTNTKRSVHSGHEDFVELACSKRSVLLFCFSICMCLGLLKYFDRLGAYKFPILLLSKKRVHIYGCLMVRVQDTEFYEEKKFPRNILMLRSQVRERNFQTYGCNNIWLLCTKPADELHNVTLLQILPWLLCTKPADGLHDVTLLQIHSLLSP